MNKLNKIILSALFLMVAFILLSFRMRVLIEFIPLVFLGLSVMCLWSARSIQKKKNITKNPKNWVAPKFRHIEQDKSVDLREKELNK